MALMASQITSLTIVYSTVYSDADQRKHRSSASLAFVPVTGEFPTKRASNAEKCPYDDVFMVNYTIAVSILQKMVREDWLK